MYPHDSDIGVAAQQYLPDELRGTRYYEPTNHGQERDVQARLEKIRRILDGDVSASLTAWPRLPGPDADGSGKAETGSKRSFRASPSPNTPSGCPDVRADTAKGRAIRP